MRHAGVAIVLLLALLPAGARAKGPDTARICGATSCVSVTDVERVNFLALQSGFALRNAPPAAPFYTVELSSSRVEDENLGWSFLYVPSTQSIRVNRANFSGGLYAEQGKR